MPDFIVPLAAALCAGIAAFCAADVLFSVLADMRIEKEESAGSYERARLPIVFRLALLLSPNALPLVRAPAFAELRKKTAEQLAMSGFEQTVSAERFLSMRAVLAAVGAALALLLAFSGNAMTGFLIFALLTVYPGIWLVKAVRKRHSDIFRALPNVLDLLTLSVEAGKDFLSALRDILPKRKPDALGDELARALQEIQLGKKRGQALLEMADRIRQPELSSVVNAIVQADEMGVSIGALLKIQSDQLRVKRFALAEKLANEVPVKILFPIVIFIMPAVFLILLGPLMMQAFAILGK